jgi:hypothetical protein
MQTSKLIGKASFSTWFVLSLPFRWSLKLRCAANRNGEGPMASRHLSVSGEIPYKIVSKRKTAQKVEIVGRSNGLDFIAGYLSASSKPRSCPMLDLQQAEQQAVPEMRILSMTEVYEKMSAIARTIGYMANLGAKY